MSLGRSPELGPSDIELLAGIARGSQEAFRTLFRRWSPRLLPFLIGATGSREVAEDLLQEAFMRILKAAPAFKPTGKASAWIYRICSNLAYSYWRRQQHSPLVSLPYLEEMSSARPAPTDAGPDIVYMQAAFTRDLRAALAALPANQRMVFLMKADLGLTYEEVAAVLRCPAGTAKSRFHHAVRKLRATLHEWADGLTEQNAPAPLLTWNEHSRAGEN